MKSNVKKLVEQAIAEGTVFYENIPLLRRSPMSMESRIHMGDSVIGVVILAEDADSEPVTSLMRFVGHKVPFVLTKIGEDGVVYGSRKLAIDTLKSSMLQALSDGKPFAGVVSKLVPYGAYVEVNGVPGLLRNGDATSDHSELSEYLKVGDPITVICRDIDKQGRINWKLNVPFHRTEPIVLDFSEETVTVGEVNGITGFRNSTGVGVFVHVAKGVDALCSMPEFEVYRGQRVAVKILRITSDPNNPTAAPKVRGKILRAV